MKQNFKKSFYVFCFSLLGGLIGILAIAWLDLVYQRLDVFWIVASAFLFAAAGYWSGEYWWKQIYELQRYKDLPKKNKWFLEVTLFLAIVAGIFWLATAQAPTSTPTKGPNMQISSAAFTEGQPIPKIYSCVGEGINPPLSFQNVPAEAQSLALIVHDPDAPIAGGFTHWVVFNMPPETMQISQNSKPPGVQAKNGAGQNSYAGPCPPSGTHRYFFYLYALDKQLDTKSVKDEASLRDAMTGHIIEETQLMGTFAK